MIRKKTPAWGFECVYFETAETRSSNTLFICHRLQAALILAVFLHRQTTLRSSVAAAFLPGLLLGPLSIPTCCWNTVYTLSITVSRGPTNLPGSAGSMLRKYTPLINVVATLQGKVFLYLTIKTNHMRIRVLRNTIYLFMFCGSIPWHNLCFWSVWNLN